MDNAAAVLFRMAETEQGASFTRSARLRRVTTVFLSGIGSPSNLRFSMPQAGFVVMIVVVTGTTRSDGQPPISCAATTTLYALCDAAEAS
jgi:hypothetical protein